MAAWEDHGVSSFWGKDTFPTELVPGAGEHCTDWLAVSLTKNGLQSWGQASLT